MLSHHEKATFIGSDFYHIFQPTMDQGSHAVPENKYSTTSKEYYGNEASLNEQNLPLGCRGGLDLSKEVLWISVGQRTAKLQVFKVEDLKKILPLGRSQTKYGRPKLKSCTIR